MDAFFNQLRLKFGTNTIFVGIHVRRTDFLEFLGKGKFPKELRISWYLKSMEIMKTELLKRNPDKKSSVIFLVSSDDNKWCRNNVR